MSESFASAVHQLLHDSIEQHAHETVYAKALSYVLSRFSHVHPETLGLIEAAVLDAGGQTMLAVPIAAAWRALHLAARLLDDAEDGDSARWQPSSANWEIGRIINLGTGFIGISNLILTYTEQRFSAQQSLWFHRRFNQVMMAMAAGQHLDLQAHGVQSLSAYWQHIQGKSGAFFGLAAEAGANCGSPPKEALAHYYNFGYNLGIALQLINDLNGFFQEDHHSDLIAGKQTLIHYFLADVAPDYVQEELQSLWPQAPYQQATRQRIRELAYAQGADVYMLAEITKHTILARNNLIKVEKPARRLANLLSEWLKIPNDFLAR